MDKIKTNIKDRVLQFAKNKGISYEKFFKDLGLSYSNFKGKQKDSSLQSDSIEKIIAKYSDIDLYWLITGQTKYDQSEVLSSANEPQPDYTDYKTKYFECTEKYMVLNEEIKSLKSQLINLKKINQQVLDVS